MNFNLYFKELKRNRISFISWSIAVCGMIFMGMAFYPAIISDDTIEGITAIFESPLMKNMMKAFGADIDRLSNILGFYVTYSGIYTTLFAALFSALSAGRLIAQEIKDRTSEFIFTKPMTRNEILTTKIIACLTYVILLNILMTLTGYLSLEAFKGEKSYQLSSFLILSLYIMLITIIFMAIGLLTPLFSRRGRSSSSLLLGLTLGLYFIDAISRVLPGFAWIGYISPFKFIDTDLLRTGYSLETWRILYFLVISTIMTAAAYLIFRKKDILV